MKSGQCGRSWTFLVLVALCSPVLGQSPLIAGDNDTGPASLCSAIPDATVVPIVPSIDDGGPPSTPSPKNKTEQPYGWHIGIYPALAWAPIFGVGFTLPPLPSNPMEPVPGSTDTSFNGAYFGGARIEPGKWSVDFLFMWAGLGAQRTTPYAKMDLNFVFGDAMLGRQVLPGLYAEGGFRRLALDLHAAVESEDARRSPGYWDPLLGLTYRRELGKKWRILIHGDGGGFGVGSDVDLTATGRAEWQFARHVGLAMGYGGMHFSQVSSVNGQNVTINPTMHGPIFGFGVFF